MVEHTVYFDLEDGEGSVVPAGQGYARISVVTVRLRAQGPTVWAGAIRCRKDGRQDRRLGGRTLVGVDVPDSEHWIKRAEEGNEVAVRNDWWSFPVESGTNQPSD